MNANVYRAARKNLLSRNRLTAAPVHGFVMWRFTETANVERFGRPYRESSSEPATRTVEGERGRRSVERIAETPTPKIDHQG
jgi:hypothetical protein